MTSEKKFDVNYDYEVVLLLTDSTETLVGGSTKIIKNALKNIESPNLAVKDLDIYLREQPLGTLAIDIFRSLSDAEKLQELSDRLYANLCDKNSNSRRIAETLNSLNYSRQTKALLYACLQGLSQNGTTPPPIYI